MYKMLYILPMIIQQLKEVDTVGITISIFQMEKLRFRRC